MNSVIDLAKAKIRGLGLRLALPESTDARILAASELLRKEDLAHPVLLHDTDEISPALVSALMARRPKLSTGLAEKMLRRPLFRAGAMVAGGAADAMLAGVANPTAKVIEAAMMTIGLAPGIQTPSSFFLMQWPNRKLLFADCALNVQPSPDELADIAISTALSARAILGEEARVALLSFSTHGSAQHADVTKIMEAAKRANALRPDLKMSGELQGDAALSQIIAEKKLKHPDEVAGRANVLIFPDLDAGNIAYKLLQQLGGATAIGPVLQGFARPVSDLSRGASTSDIVDTACLLLALSLQQPEQTTS